MIRFFSVHNDPLRGTHLHLCRTEHGTLAAACKKVKERVANGTISKAPLFYDYGTGDSDLRHLDKLPCWTDADIPAVA